MKLDVVEADLESLPEQPLALGSLGTARFLRLDLAGSPSLGSNSTVTDSILLTVYRLLCRVGWNLVVLSSNSSKLETWMKGHQRNALLKPARNLRSRKEKTFSSGISFSCPRKAMYTNAGFELSQILQGLDSVLWNQSCEFLFKENHFYHWGNNSSTWKSMAWAYQRGKLLVGNDLIYLYN